MKTTDRHISSHMFISSHIQIVCCHQQLQCRLWLDIKRRYVSYIRIRVLQLVVEVLADLLENGRADLRETDLAAIRLGE